MDGPLKDDKLMISPVFTIISTYGSFAEAVDPWRFFLLEVVDHHDDGGDAERHEEEGVEGGLHEPQARRHAREQKDLGDDTY